MYRMHKIVSEMDDERINHIQNFIRTILFLCIDLIADGIASIASGNFGASVDDLLRCCASKRLNAYELTSTVGK